jgi:hypothetical protein
MPLGSADESPRLGHQALEAFISFLQKTATAGKRRELLG